MAHPKHVLLIRFGDEDEQSASIHATTAAAEKALARWVKYRWEEDFGTPLDVRLDAGSLIAEYFAANPDLNTYEIVDAGRR